MEEADAIKTSGGDGRPLESSEDVVYASSAPCYALQRPYTFWFFRKTDASKSVDYEKGIRPIATVSTTKEFWDAYSHLLRPGRVQNNTDYHLFRAGIKPMWEDDANRAGGKWTLRMRKGLSSKLWEDILLAIVGNQFENGEGICGAVLSLRYYEDVLSLWVGPMEADASQRVRRKFVELLGLPESTRVDFKKHDESLRDSAVPASRATVLTSASGSSAGAADAAVGAVPDSAETLSGGRRTGGAEESVVAAAAGSASFSSSSAVAGGGGGGSGARRRPVEMRTEAFR